MSISENRKENKPWLIERLDRNISWLLIVLLLLAIASPWVFTRYGPEWLNFTESGNIGSLIGGVVTPFLTLITIILIYLTYNHQKEELRKTSRSLEKQSQLADIQKFENGFFELLKIHRENVSQIGYEDQRGRSAFIRMIREYNQIYSDLTDPMESIDMQDNYSDFDLADIAFIIFYVGVENDSMQLLFGLLQEQHEFDEPLLKNVTNHFVDKQKDFKDRVARHKGNRKKPLNPNWGDIHRKARLYKYEGQKSNLGHYFKNLTQTLRFIKEQSKRNELINELYYAEIYKSQFSDYELALIFIYSISTFGNNLEWGFSKRNPKPLIIAEKIPYISEFKMFDGLIGDIIKYVEPSDFYDLEKRNSIYYHK